MRPFQLGPHRPTTSRPSAPHLLHQAVREVVDLEDHDLLATAALANTPQAS